MVFFAHGFMSGGRSFAAFLLRQVGVRPLKKNSPGVSSREGGGVLSTGID